jgi:hypothetical protein
VLRLRFGSLCARVSAATIPVEDRARLERLPGLVVARAGQRRAVNADIPNSTVRKSGMLKIIEVLEGRWEMLVR